MKPFALSACLAVCIIGPGARAEEGMLVPPIEHQATLKECGACHLAFPPQMLPARSWKKLMGDLANHFGENAARHEATRAEVAAYLAANAGDAAISKQGRRFLRGIDASETPVRITQTPFWQAAHEEVSPARFLSDAVKTPANCAACHRTAAKGVFGEGEEEE
jgi:diheme cytochrome c